MTNGIMNLTLRKVAIIAGLGYLVVFILGIFANFIAFENLIVAGDAVTTADNILSNELLFRLGIAGWVIIMVFDLIVAWALFIFLRPVNRNLSLLAAWFRMVFVSIFGLALVNLFSVLQLFKDADYSQAMLLLDAYRYSINISFVFFGIHIFLLGYLIYKSDYVPKILGILLMIAFVGYMIDSFGNFISTSYANSAIAFFVFIAVPAFIAELSLTIWLLFKGGKK